MSLVCSMSSIRGNQTVRLFCSADQEQLSSELSVPFAVKWFDFTSRDADDSQVESTTKRRRTELVKKRIWNSLTCKCGSDSSCSNSLRSRLYLCPGAEQTQSTTSRLRATASPVGARDGDITVLLILSYNCMPSENEIIKKWILFRASFLVMIFSFFGFWRRPRRC